MKKFFKIFHSIPTFKQLSSEQISQIADVLEEVSIQLYYSKSNIFKIVLYFYVRVYFKYEFKRLAWLS